MSESYRNPYVLRQQSGHPGFRATIVYGTRTDLANLGRKLLDASEKPAVAVSEFATVQNGQNSRVYLEFRSATPEEIDSWHKPLLKNRLLGAVKWIFVLVVFALALIGYRSLVN